MQNTVHYKIDYNTKYITIQTMQHIQYNTITTILSITYV